MIEPTETFGQRLRRLREACGLRKTGLARRVGLTEAAIRQLESGHTKSPTLVVGLRIAKLLGVSPDYLAIGDETADDAGVLRVMLTRLDDHERRLAQAERRLSP
jgi:transcriptional regulator with XRE-family HTH domain